nr:hypothetical protein [uncultured Devosia sp.]
MSIKPFFATALVTCALLTAPAQAYEHAATGFGVDLPEEFVVDPDIPQQDDYDIVVGINPVSGNPAPADTNPHVCQAGFQGSDGNAGMTQKQINVMAAKNNDWTRQIVAAFSQVMDIGAYENFTLSGIVGIQLITTPKFGPDAANNRIVLSFMETPKGRTMLVCTATRDNIWAALPVFKTIRGGITPPR